MKNIIFGLNTETKQLAINIQSNNLKNKLASTIKPKSTWVILTDKIPTGVQLQTVSEFNKYITKTKDKIIHNIIIIARTRKIPIIGIGVSDEIYNKEGKLDGEGNCIDCKIVIHKIEKTYKDIIEKHLNIGNVFTIIDDIHLRTRSTKEYGLRSKLFYNDAKFQIIRPIKKNIL